MKTVDNQRPQGPAGGAFSDVKMPLTPVSFSRTSAALSFVGGALIGLLGTMSSAHAAKPFQDAKGNVPARGAEKERNATDRRLVNVEAIHLGQLHSNGPNPDPKFFDAVVRSQLKIADALRYAPSANVILESLTDDLTQPLYALLSQGGAGTDLAYAKRTFPNGLPKTIEECNKEQRKFLYNYGSVRALYYLGEVRHVRAAIDPQVDNELRAMAQIYGQEKYGLKPKPPGNETNRAAAQPDEPAWPEKIKWDPKLSHLILYRREVEALKKAELAVRENPNRVFIIFGAGHDFSYHADKFPNVTLTTTDLSGRAPAAGAGTPKK